MIARSRRKREDGHRMIVYVLSVSATRVGGATSSAHPISGTEQFEPTKANKGQAGLQSGITLQPCSTIILVGQ
jgi:hypothetical protein